MFLEIPQCQGGPKANVGKRPKSRTKLRLWLEDREGWARRCENGRLTLKLSEESAGYRHLAWNGFKHRKVSGWQLFGIMMRRAKRESWKTAEIIEKTRFLAENWSGSGEEL